MDSMSSWYEQQAILRKSLRTKSKIKEALDLAIFQHEQVHSSTMLGKKELGYPFASARSRHRNNKPVKKFSEE